MAGRYDPVWVATIAFVIAALGGIAACLRTKEQITCKRLVAAFLYSGLIGLCVCFIWYNYFDGQDNIMFLLGLSGIAGICGAGALDLLLLLWHGKIVINIRTDPGHTENVDEQQSVDSKEA